jgi:hypothetical protein
MTRQFCYEDGHDDNSYMLRPDLWEKVIGKPYHYGSGWPAWAVWPNGSFLISFATKILLTAQVTTNCISSGAMPCVHCGVVAGPSGDLTCSTIEQLRLVNALCWAKNVADGSR